MFFVAGPSQEGIECPEVDVDTRRLHLSSIHFFQDTGFDRSPDFFWMLDRGQVRLEGVPCLSIAAKGHGGTVLKEAAFFQEGLVESFGDQHFCSQHLYEQQG